MGTLDLTEGGLETSLIFQQGVDLPLFAAFPLVQDEVGRGLLRTYWQPYVELVENTGVSFVVDTATWRANPDWATQLGYDAHRLAGANQAAVALTREIAAEMGGAKVNGVVGPRGDGFIAGEIMTPEQAETYHFPQVKVLAEAGVDQVSAITFSYPQEAVGLVRAARSVAIPAVVSFTVETDGRLPDGHSLRDAVEEVDRATDRAAVGFMINCAHPSHFAAALEDGPWLERITGVRANASTMSHSELDQAEELDAGDPQDLAARCMRLLDRLPALTVLGGCCGTDHRHIAAIHAACCAS